MAVLTAPLRPTLTGLTNASAEEKNHLKYIPEWWLLSRKKAGISIVFLHMHTLRNRTERAGTLTSRSSCLNIAAVS